MKLVCKYGKLNVIQRTRSALQRTGGAFQWPETLQKLIDLDQPIRSYSRIVSKLNVPKRFFFILRLGGALV